MKQLPCLSVLVFGVFLFSEMPSAFGQEVWLGRCEPFGPESEVASITGLTGSPLGPGPLLVTPPLAPRFEIGPQLNFSDRTDITVGPEWIGKLRDNDQRDRVRGTPCNVCVVKLEKDKTYFIDMKMSGKQIDSYLHLEDINGRHLDSDDDSGGQLLMGGEKYAETIARYWETDPHPYSGSSQDARIKFRCEEGGVYRIIATTYEGATGTYRLQVTEESIEQEYNQFLLEATRFLRVVPPIMALPVLGAGTVGSPLGEGPLLAVSALFLGRRREMALANYTQALAIHKSVDVFRDRGLVYTYLAQQSKEFNKAKYFQRARTDDMCAIALNLQDGYSWYFGGIDYTDLGNLKTKHADVDPAKKEEIDPAKKEILNEAIRDFGKAINAFTRATELGMGKALYNPTGHSTHPYMLDDYFRARGVAYTNRANAYKKLQQMDKARQDDESAREDDRKAVELDPTEAPNFRNRGVDHARLTQWRYAIDDYRKAVDLAGNAVELAGKEEKLAKKAKDLYEKGQYVLPWEPSKKGQYILPGTLTAYLGKEPAIVYRSDYRTIVLAQYNTKVAEKKRAWADYLNTAAWTLATAPDATVRNGREAVELAKEAVDLARKVGADKAILAQYRDTLAAAYAELGDFEEAIEKENQAIALLPSDHPDRRDYESRLKQYRNKNPGERMGREAFPPFGGKRR